jgi:hypothetical protein
MALRSSSVEFAPCKRRSRFILPVTWLCYFGLTLAFHFRTNVFFFADEY